MKLEHEHQIIIRKASIYYALFATLWIFCSDMILNWIVQNNQSTFQIFQSVKGFFFVIVTSIFLYWYLKKKMFQIQQFIHSLNESERRMELALESGRFGLWEWDLQSNNMKWDKQIHQMLGIEHHNISATFDEFIKIVLDEDMESLKLQHQNAIDHQDNIRSSFRVKKQDGTFRYIDSRSKFVFDKTNQPVSMIGICWDISQSIQSTQALQHSETLLRNIIDSIPHYIYVKDQQGKFAVVNNAYANTFHLSPAEMIGSTTYQLSPNIDDPTSNHDNDLQVIHTQQSMLIQQETITNENGDLQILQSTKLPIDIHENKKGVLCISIDITDSLEMESKLLESEERLNLALESSNIGTWEWDLQSNTLKWDKVTYRLLGIQPDSFGKTYEEFIRIVYPDDRAYLKRKAEECIQSNKKLQTEYRLLLPDHSIHWMSGRGRVHYDSSGKPHRMIGVIWDITEDKKREEKIQQLTAAVEQSSVSVMITNLDGVIEYVNPIFTELTGYTFDEAIGNHPSILRSGHHTNAFYDELWKTVKSGNNWKGTMCNKKKDGSLYWESANISPVKDKDGNIINFIAVKENITKRKQLEEAYEVLVNQSILGLFILQNQKLVFGNNRFSEICGYTLEVLYQMNFEDILGIVHQDDREIIKNQHFKRFNHEPVSSIYEFRCIKRNGDITWLQAHSSLITYQGSPAIQTAIIDITERKNMEEQLHQSQKMESIGQLAGGIAHDFNNLLMAIKMNTEFALSEINESSPARSDLEEVQKAAKRAADLTRQLLAFSRKQVLSPKVINLNDLIENIDKMLHRIIGENITLSTTLSPALGNIKADPGQIEQIILNLTVNARDAMKDNGKIAIETQNVELDEHYTSMQIDFLPGLYVMLTVSDNGCGIPKKLLDKIFDPFFTTKEKGKGTGLGLSTVFGIVKQSGGEINVYSEPGHGTTFHIYFPRVDTDVEPEIQSLPQQDLKGTETILIVEDDYGVRQVVTRILKDNGYKTFIAQNSTDALQLIESKQSEIDLILSDVILPDFNGKLLIDKVLQINPNIKALLMSGYTDNAILHNEIMVRKIEFLHKPFTAKSLLIKVKHILES